MLHKMLKQVLEAYNSTTKDGDEECFAILNAFILMMCREDKLNIPKPHVVVCSSTFQTAEQWHDQEEACHWDKHVLVSFQENAWVDSCTQSHGL